MSKGKWIKKKPIESITYKNINSNNYEWKATFHFLANLYNKNPNKEIPIILFLNKKTIGILNQISKKTKYKIESIIKYHIYSLNRNFMESKKNNKELENFIKNLKTKIKEK